MLGKDPECIDKIEAMVERDEEKLLEAGLTDEEVAAVIELRRLGGIYRQGKFGTLRIEFFLGSLKK